MHMKFPPRFILQILALDPPVTVSAQALIHFMIMPCAIRFIAVDVEITRLERFLTGLADKAPFVVSTRETAIGRGDGFAFDEEGAAAAFALVGSVLTGRG